MSRLSEVLRESVRLRKWSESAAHLPLFSSLWAKLSANSAEVKRFAKFALVGMLGAVVDFSVLNLMKWLLESLRFGQEWNVGMAARQIQLIAANAVSFTLAVLSNFTWNRLWTFPESRERPVGQQLGQFAVVNVVGLAINTLLLIGLDHYVFRNFVADRVSYNLAKAVAIGVVLFWNFGVNRIWTYRGIK